jgi:hypothetical protein
MDIDRYLADLAKYTDPYSILVMRGSKLIRLRTPFRVVLLLNYADYIKGEILTVDKIMVTRRLEMVYIVTEQGFPASICQILLF